MIAATIDIDALYRTHADEIRRYCHSISNSMDPDDACQDTFLKAFQARESFIPGTNARAWLFQIARHIVIDTHRHETIFEVKPLEFVPEDMFAREETDRDEHIDQYAKIARLSDVQRQILHLYAEGYACREIATMTQQSVHAVKAKMYRARKALNFAA